MTHLSSKAIEEKVQRKLFKQLSDLCVGSSGKYTQNVLTSILTDTEQRMIAKRLAAILMLHEGCSQYAVENTLNISSSTVSRIRRSYVEGTYDFVCSVYTKRTQDKKDFWKTIEVLANLGMPSKAGDRWKFLRDTK